MAAAAPAREIVLVDCPDEVGLIHRITGVLQARRLNIESNSEFVDVVARQFFFRAEVAPTDGQVPAEAVEADLRRVLRDGIDEDGLEAAIREAIARKPKGHDFVIDRSGAAPSIHRHMNTTGG